MAKKTKMGAPALYKVLMDGCPIWGGALEYSLPTEAGPGEWHEVDGDVVRCKNGLHLTDDPSRRWQEGAECYLVETDGPVLPPSGDHDDEYVARKVRLVRRLTWVELAAFGVHPRGDKPIAPTKKGRATQPTPPAGPSPAMKLMRCAWENHCGATPHSWRTVNATMQKALTLAITGGMSFAEGDFAEIRRAMRGGYWMGETSEHFYSAACQEGNLQACKSYEAWCARKPFVWEGERLYVGREFMWEGIAVTVTSFQDEGHALIACSYAPSVKGRCYRGSQIARRFSLTNDQIARAEKDRKTTVKVTQDAVALQALLGKCNLFVDIGTLVGWTPEERESAGEWALIAQHDAGKKRVKLPPAPSHMEAALSVAAQKAAQEEIENWQERIRRAESDKVDADKTIAYAMAALKKLRAKGGEEVL